MRIFEFDDYKAWLSQQLKLESRGGRSKLAKTIRCHLAYISQVLEGFANFTPEQAVAITTYYHLNAEEKEFFMLLVQKERAGTTELKNYYQEKLNRAREERNKILTRVKNTKKLTPEQEARYYSSWHYIAAYVLTSVSSSNSPEIIATKLNVSHHKAIEILNFLIEIGLLEITKNQYKIKETATHLPATSPLISKHHTNWRIQAINSLDQTKQHDLHFSTVYSLSVNDFKKIKGKILDLIEEISSITQASAEETVICLNFDLFEI